MNKATGNFTAVKPATYNEKRVEAVEFETVVAEDGTQYTVRVNETTGKPEYMDWDTGAWIEYGDDMVAEANEDTGQDAIMYKGQETVYYPAEINNVFYLNEMGEYAFVPASYLATTKHIRGKITEIQEYLPKWTNDIEIVMVLQICGYHVPSAMRYAKHNGLGLTETERNAGAIEDKTIKLQKELAETKESLEYALKDAKGEAAREAERNKKEAERLVAAAKRREENAEAQVKKMAEKLSQLEKKLAVAVEEGVQAGEMSKRRQTMVRCRLVATVPLTFNPLERLRIIDERASALHCAFPGTFGFGLSS